MFEVCSGCLVFRVLETSYSTGRCLALTGCAGEEVAKAAIVVLNGDIRFEKCVNGGAPSLLKFL